MTPAQVLAGLVLGQPVDLGFSPHELVALIGAAPIAVLIPVDGERNWPKGAERIAPCPTLGVAFFSAP